MKKRLIKSKTQVRKQNAKHLPPSIVLRGRTFTAEDIKIIKETTVALFSEGRYKISIEVCRLLNWTQPNGWLKDRACRDVLRALDARRYITLPKAKIRQHQKRYSQWKPAIPVDHSGLVTITNVSARISLDLAKGTNSERAWNTLVQQHHYLGHKVTVGKCLKFLVRAGDIILGAVSLAECAWSIEDRDKALSSLGISKHEVADNNRFLILPNVRVKNLASRVLSLLVRHGVREWKTYYSIQLKCIETFVDTSRFGGTSYKAANWICVGQTKGFRKSGGHHLNGQTAKSIYLYPMNSRHRDKLKNHVSSTKL